MDLGPNQSVTGQSLVNCSIEPAAFSLAFHLPMRHVAIIGGGENPESWGQPPVYATLGRNPHSGSNTAAAFLRIAESVRPGRRRTLELELGIRSAQGGASDVYFLSAAPFFYSRYSLPALSSMSDASDASVALWNLETSEWRFKAEDGLRLRYAMAPASIAEAMSKPTGTRSATSSRMTSTGSAPIRHPTVARRRRPMLSASGGCSRPSWTCGSGRPACWRSTRPTPRSASRPRPCARSSSLERTAAPAAARAWSGPGPSSSTASSRPSTPRTRPRRASSLASPNWTI